MNEKLLNTCFIPWLELGQKLQHLPAEGEVESILVDFARTTQAQEAGLCAESTQGLQNHAAACVDATASSSRFPWDDAKFSQSIRDTEQDVIAHRDDAGNWLLAAAWEPRTGQRCWAWLRRPASTAWSADEADLLPFLAQKYVRWLGKRPDFLRTFTCLATQQRLEHTAQITSKLSHDFGNQLTGIMGFTELSLMQLPADSPVRGHLKEVLSLAIEGGQWIHKLHRFCRRMQVSPHVSTSLQSVLASEKRRLAKAHGLGLQFKTSLAAGLPELRIDSESLQKLLGELLLNSTEAMQGAGDIRVAAQAVEVTAQDASRLLGGVRAGPHVEIVIQDTGPGLSDEARDKLFHDMYYSSKFRKRGLGLLMVHGLMMTHQGGFHWEQIPGQGLKTRVCLPVAAPKQSR